MSDAAVPLKAPFPYPGGKSRVADLVWERLGNVDNYVEPFMGSLAVLLRRPADHFRDGYRVETCNDLNHYVCLAPDTRVLRADLKWVRIGDVRQGDELLGFDEFNGERRPDSRAPQQYRRWRHTKVVATRLVEKPCYRLTFSDGTVVVASADHQWLCGSKDSGGCSWRWATTESMAVGGARSRVLKLCEAVDREESWEGGWLGGMFDGEGSVSAKVGWRLCLAQKPGITLDRAEQYLKARRFAYTRTDSPSGVSSLLLGGGMREVLRLLMLVRPERLIRNAVAKIENFSLYGRQHHSVALVQKEFVGNREVVALETDRHTFIAEGLASHNCNFWRAVKADPEKVAEYADNPVLEADLHARHKWLVRSSEAAAWRKRMAEDPEAYDAKVAGWWVWGCCCWIGGAWCNDSPNNRPEHEQRPNFTTGLGDDAQSGGRKVCCDKEKMPEMLAGRGVTASHGKLGDLGRTHRPLAGRGVTASHAQRPDLTSGGCGDSATAAGRPQLTDAFDIGRGVNAGGALKRPQDGGANEGFQGVNANATAGTCDARRAWLVDWFRRLADRLRLVRTCYGHWSRVCDSDSTLTRLGTTGVFLDPPYPAKSTNGKKSRDPNLYATDKGGDLDTLRDEVLAWCRRWGGDRQIRIAVCGYEGDGYEALVPEGWTEHAWEASGGYGNQRRKGKGKGKSENAARERIWFSPACLSARIVQPSLFAA